MRKKLSVFLALCLLLSFAACGDTAGGAASGTAAGQPESTVSVQEPAAQDEAAEPAEPDRRDAQRRVQMLREQIQDRRLLEDPLLRELHRIPF